MPTTTPITINNAVYLSSPQSKAEWEQYYHLRWLLLRKDWLQPVGSERDEHEPNAFHIMARAEKNDLVIGIGRIHKTINNSAQIRYMAVHEAQQRKGIGTLIIQALEQQADVWDVSRIILNARNDFIKFYSKMGYQAVGAGETLFDSIHHTKMEK